MEDFPENRGHLELADSSEGVRHPVPPRLRRDPKGLPNIHVHQAQAINEAPPAIGALSHRFFFGWEIRFPDEIDHRKKRGYQLILTSLLDLVKQPSNQASKGHVPPGNHRVPFAATLPKPAMA